MIDLTMNFVSFLTAPNTKDSRLLETRLRPNLKMFQYKIWSSVKR